jgi:integral membrane protein
VTEPTTPAVSLPSVARLLRAVSLVEGVSYLVLLGCVVAKYAFDAPGEGGVPIMGPTHGTIFLIFAVLVLVGREEQGWSGGQTLLALVLSAVPLGGFYVERQMVRVPGRDAPAPA